MRRLVETGRCYWQQIDGTPLSLGATRRGGFAWRLDRNGNQAVEARLAEGNGEILPCAAPWYVDPARNLAGPVDFGVPPGDCHRFPGGAAGRANRPRRWPKRWRGAFRARLAGPRTDIVEEVRDGPPVPVLRLTTRKRAYRYSFGPGRHDDRIDIALFGYEYDGKIIDARSAPPSCVRSRTDASSCGGAITWRKPHSARSSRDLGCRRPPISRR